MNRFLLATLVLGLAVTAGNARAEASNETSVASSATIADFSTLSSYDCVGNVCVGMTVRVNSGAYGDERGQVVAVDPYQDEITVVNSQGYTMTVRSYDVSPDLAQPSSSGCVANICIGDQVRVLVGVNAGRIGTVVDADDFNYTATILVGGTYIIEDVRDLTLSVRPTVIRPFPNYPRNCAFGDYIYDIYRGCVRIYYPYPRPYIHPIPYPRPLPRPYPVPRGRPMPPRPYPVPRGPMPPRGPVVIHQPPRAPIPAPRMPTPPSRPIPAPRMPTQPSRPIPAPRAPAPAPRMPTQPSRPAPAPRAPAPRGGMGAPRAPSPAPRAPSMPRPGGRH